MSGVSRTDDDCDDDCDDDDKWVMTSIISMTVRGVWRERVRRRY